MANAIEFSLGYDLKPMRSSGQQAIALNQKTMATMQKSAKAAGRGISLLAGAVGTGAFVAGTRSITGLASEINDLSSSVGLGAEEFQRYSFAVEQSGGKQTDLVRGMGALIAKIEDAKQGNEKAIATFAALGVSMNDIESKSPDQILLKVSDALQKSGASGKDTAAVMELIGSKVALKLIPSLKGGSDAFLQMGKDADIMSQQTIEAIDATDDAFNKMLKNARSKLAMQAVGIADFFSGGKVLGTTSTPATTPEELKAAKAANDARKAAAQGEPSPVDAPYNSDRFGVRGLSPVGYNTPLSNKGGLPSNFETAFTPSLHGDLMKGGTMRGPFAPQVQASGGLGATSGLIRRGDAGRKKAADAAQKSAEAKELEALNQKMDDYWGGGE